MRYKQKFLPKTIRSFEVWAPSAWPSGKSGSITACIWSEITNVPVMGEDLPLCYRIYWRSRPHRHICVCTKETWSPSFSSTINSLRLPYERCIMTFTPELQLKCFDPMQFDPAGLVELVCLPPTSAHCKI